MAPNCDMNEEMRQDCVDLVITASERYQSNYEVREKSCLSFQRASRLAESLENRCSVLYNSSETAHPSAIAACHLLSLPYCPCLLSGARTFS
eukprot:6180187-Pleurochrysis_carterae.AAC.2